MLRHGFNVFSSAYEVYIDGFPRSGNTFALTAFMLANPDALVRSHRHIPTFIVQSVKRRKPGMVLLRNPIDAASSWSIHEAWPFRQSLAYYVDFHSVLLRHRERLFFVSFEEVIEDFGRVIANFNRYWGSAFAPFQHTTENVARCFAQIESEHTKTEGQMLELRVPRPSSCRQELKRKLLSQLRTSAALQTELRRADELYQKLVPKHFPQKPRPALAKTTQSIRLRAAG
jgi:hypothetical protein